MNFRSTLLIFIACYVFMSKEAVYESQNSEDIDFFLSNNPEDNSAIMFYNPVQEGSDEETLEMVKKVIGIFLNIGEEGRSEEDWINGLNDKVHLMRVDTLNPDHSEVVKDYKVTHTPLIILFEKSDILYQEVLHEKSYDHIKDILMDKIEERQGANNCTTNATDSNSTDSNSTDSNSTDTNSTTPDGDSGTGANSTNSTNSEPNYSDEILHDEIEQASKAADEALKELNDLRETFEQYLKVEQAQKEADDAKKRAEEAEKQLEQVTKQLLEANESKNSSEADNKSDSSKDNSVKEIEIDYPIKIEYVPIYRRFNQSYPQIIQPSDIPFAPRTTTRYILSDDHWKIIEENDNEGKGEGEE